MAASARRTIVCTIYDVRLEPAIFSRLVRVPIAVLNDRIIGVAARIGADVIDLRAVCTGDADFVLQIEPSAAGAEKIARSIATVVEGRSPSIQLTRSTGQAGPMLGAREAIRK